jgi:predicted nicotinamide N-methyase
VIIGVMSFVFDFGFDDAAADASAAADQPRERESSLKQQQQKQAEEHFVVAAERVPLVPSELVPLADVVDLVSVSVITQGQGGGVDAGLSVFQRVVDGSETKLQGILQSTDIESGVYEGGFKVWEGSVDLCRFLMGSGAVSVSGKSVCELGCGLGLPGVVCATRLGATRCVWQDLNTDVLRDSTMYSALLSAYDPAQGDLKSQVLDQSGAVATDTSWDAEHVAAVQEKGAWVAGDWRDPALSELLLEANGGKLFDVVLTSETVYNVEFIPGLLRAISSVLDKESGVAYIASKRYYFGIGGGVFDLQRIIDERFPELEYSTAHTIQDNTSTHRDVVAVKFK